MSPRSIHDNPHIEKLLRIVEGYAQHQSWRCEYRSRFKTCRCGLDEALAELGLPPVPPHDPEAKRD